MKGGRATRGYRGDVSCRVLGNTTKPHPKGSWKKLPLL